MRAAIPGERRDPLASEWLALIPGLITLLVALDRIGGPSFTRDEGATLLAVHRSFPEMLRMVGMPFTVNIACARRELGYQPIVTWQSGIAAMSPRSSNPLISDLPVNVSS